MSYIRSTSNPEHLYIWSDGDEVTIQMGPKILGQIPEKIFNGLIKKYHRNYLNLPCKYKGCTINESENFGIELTYKDIIFEVCYVTWDALVYYNYKSIIKNERHI